MAERVRWVRDARVLLADLGLKATAAIARLDDAAGGGYPGREVARPLVGLTRAMYELEAFEVVLRDVERGLIDFPGILPDGSGELHDCGGRSCPARGTPAGTEVYLCWLLDDEKEIRFWHPIETGFAGRRPLA